MLSVHGQINLYILASITSTWCNNIANIMKKVELRRQGTLPEMVVQS